MSKAQNLQDVFLAAARRGEIPVTVFMVNGFQMRGVITGFDSFTVVLNCDGKQNMVYKHAISTVSPLHPIDLSEWEEGLKDACRPGAEATPL